jgi:hypothetical protein
MRWGRRRHPDALTINPEGLIELPRLKRTRLAYAIDATTVERLIEAVVDRRPARDDLLPLRDAAFIGAMGFSIATRPKEWRESATWDNLFPPNDVSGIGSIVLQMDRGRGREEVVSGLKNGAHVALLFANALASYSGHDVKTLETYYRHIIERYMGQSAIDMPDESRAARAQVGGDPFHRHSSNRTST